MKKNLYSVWWNNEIVIDAVKNAESIAGVIRILGLAVSGATYSAAKRHIKRLGLDTTHFDPYGSRIRPNKLSNEEIFISESTCDRSTVRKRILKQNLIPYRCSKCDNPGRWLEENLTLQLEHKNGKRNDNRIENLEFLCPNCHTQTKTWGSKNQNNKLV